MIIACVVLAFDMSTSEVVWALANKSAETAGAEGFFFATSVLRSVFSAFLFFSVHCAQLSVQSTSVGSIWNRDRQTDKS